MNRTAPHPFSTDEEILDAYSRLCSTLPGKKELHLFCREEHRNETTCFIRVSDSITEQAADLVQGIVFGGTVVVMIPLATDFSCPMRSNGHMRISSCDLCRRQVGSDGN